MDQIISSPKWFVLNFVPCPSCNSQLAPKPVDGEWNNVFCTWCSFACRLVVAPNNPRDKILAVRKADLENLLQLKKALPPLMIHFKWEAEGFAREQVEFWPFVAYRFLKEEGHAAIGLNPDDTPDAIIFSNMFELPSITIYRSPSDEEIADQIAQAWSQPIRASRIQETFGTGYLHAARIKELALERLRKLGRIVEEDDEDSF